MTDYLKQLFIVDYTIILSLIIHKLTNTSKVVNYYQDLESNIIDHTIVNSPYMEVEGICIIRSITWISI